MRSAFLDSKNMKRKSVIVRANSEKNSTEYNLEN
jgi:hypothetical protein